MAMFIGIIGMLGVPACLIWLIVNAVRWDSKKPPLIGMLICAVLFIAGMVMYEPEDKSPSDDIKKVSEPSKESEATPSSEPVKDTTEEPVENEISPEDDGPLKTGAYSLPCGVKLQFYDSVTNDVTGKWRRAGTSSSMPPADFAVEYYENMFSSDDEIHSVWNATLKTTTRISVSGGLLYVDTYEYVNGEEHDAKLMFSGSPLDSQIIDLETGKPVEVLEPVDISEPAPDTSTPAAKPEESKPKAPASQSSNPVKTLTPVEPTQVSSGDEKDPNQANSGNEAGTYTHDFSGGRVLITTASNNNDDPVYHTRDCRAAKIISPSDVYWYDSAQAAEADGRRLCGYCGR